MGSRCLQTRGSWSAHGLPLHVSLQIVANIICFCLCFFDAIIELQAMAENMFNDFIFGNWNWISYVIEEYLIHDLYHAYAVEAFTIS